MVKISRATEDQLRSQFPVFESACHEFFNGELTVGKFKGISGKFGCYAERGGKQGMLRLRFTGGVINKKHIHFLIESIHKYNPAVIHATTGQALQLHHLSCDTILSLYQECFDQGIYCIGGGSDNPRNVTASPLRGVEQDEYFDVSPYVDAAASFGISLIPKLHLPRKYKIGFSANSANEGHATYKDLGFLARPDGCFDVYGGGGFGAAGGRVGVLLDSQVPAGRILYYIYAFAQMFMAYGDYKNRGRARSRFIATRLGDDEFRKVFHRYLTESKQYDFHFLPQAMEITKQGDNTALAQNSRIHQQKQQGLYYVEYHPLGGTPNKDTFTALLQYLDTLDDVEIRLSADETIYAINLTGTEASKIAALTENDAAKNKFEKSTCCIGALICQQGLRDSQGMFINTVHQLRDQGVNTDALPTLHISGCPSSCTTHLINPLGFRGAAKRIDGEMKPAFTVYAGGISIAHEEQLATEYGVITEEKIPTFLVALNEKLTMAGQPFAEWYKHHEPEFAALVKQYE